MTLTHILRSSTYGGNISMAIFKYLFARRKQTEITNDRNIMKKACVILAESEAIINCIFESHKKDLLSKTPDFIIYSVFGVSKEGMLSEDQMAIHRKIDPFVYQVAGMLGIESLNTSERMAILFIIRMMIANKLLYMMELLKNTTNRQSSAKRSTQKTLEEMDTVGNA